MQGFHKCWRCCSVTAMSTVPHHTKFHAGRTCEPLPLGNRGRRRHSTHPAGRWSAATSDRRAKSHPPNHNSIYCRAEQGVKGTSIANRPIVNNNHPRTAHSLKRPDTRRSASFYTPCITLLHTNSTDKFCAGSTPTRATWIQHCTVGFRRSKTPPRELVWYNAQHAIPAYNTCIKNPIEIRWRYERCSCACRLLDEALGSIVRSKHTVGGTSNPEKKSV